ncbi:hypothetical protein NE236_38895 [Actinoallomurus purpureus]|uniref:hypothetical protein n=1 Tax=Actinoallomurus purpureus TaxID=478114 RepID=UPI00209339A6|nr:hypothetical protein [Actinoallomurus purpureus]MCO6010943.1 hypothetical protein [Actinoallomurus purpureus]
MTRPGVATVAPPWIWMFFIGYLAIGVPDSIDTWQRQLADYSGHHSVPFTLLKVFAAVELLPVAFLVAGLAGVVLPSVRGRLVERRFGLVPDDRPVIAEMRRFVEAYAPGVELRVTLRPGRQARVYPVGLRRARIAVFRPMAALWRQDRQAAQAVLLHEIAHLRQGDHLIVGLGSPFPWLVRVWAPAFLLAELLPALILFATRPPLLGTTVGAQVVLDLGAVPRQLILPVAALWLAELGADRFPAEVVGPDALRRALERSRSAPWYSPLSHPPAGVRRKLAAHPRAATLILLTGWFAALVVKLAATIAAATPAFLMIGNSVPETARGLTRGVRAFLVDGRPLLLVALALLLTWPLLAPVWTRRWSPGTPPGRPARYPLYLAATAPPTLLVLASYLIPTV